VFGVGFTPAGEAEISSLPASFIDLSQVNAFQMQSGTREIVLTIPLQVLRSKPVNWFTTKTSASTLDTVSAGQFFYVMNTSTSIANAYRMWVTIEGEIEFRGMISSANLFSHRTDQSASLVRELREYDEKESDIVEVPDFSAPYAPHE